MMKRAVKTTRRHGLTALLLALLLSACTFYLTPSELNVSAPQTIVRFEPDRGAGASYRPGQNISFALNTLQSGYVTLVVIDPDGSSYVLARNLRVTSGDNRISGLDRTTRFVVTPPAGLHLVRAFFSTWATEETRQRGRQRLEVAPSLQRGAQDVAETRFVVAPR